MVAEIRSGDEMPMATDVCIVGGGPVGQAVATALGGSGLRVTIIEAGSRLPQDTRGKLVSAEIVGDERFGPLEWKAHRALGGTSWRWAIDVDGRAQGVRHAVLEDGVVERRVVGLPEWPL